MNPFSYERATGAEAAIHAALPRGAKFLGGGTNLVDLMKCGVEHPAALVDVNHAGMDRVEASSAGATIGASVKNSDLANQRSGAPLSCHQPNGNGRGPPCSGHRRVTNQPQFR